MKRAALITLMLMAHPVFGAGLASGQSLSDLPEAAEPGACYVQIFAPETVKRVTQRVIDQPASFEIKTHPAVYERVEEQHLVKEGTTVYKAVPAVYETVFEKVEIKPGASTIVAKQKLTQPARVVEETISPEYETIMVQNLVSAERQERIETPATYTEIEKQVVTGGTPEWQALMCDEKTTPAKMAEIQSALTEAGYPAVSDGVFGPETLSAMEGFQRAQNLAMGYLTVATVQALGVSPD